MQTETIRAIQKAHVDILRRRFMNGEVFEHYGTDVRIISCRFDRPGWQIEEHTFDLTNGDTITIKVHS